MQTTKQLWLAVLFALVFIVKGYSQTTTINGLTVIVDFKDYQIEATNSQISSLVNQTSGFNLWGNTTSVREYFRIQSNNKVDMISQIIRVTLPKNSDQYISASSSQNLVPAVINAINSSNQTFSGLSMHPTQNYLWNFSMLFRSQHGGAVAWKENKNHKIKNNGDSVMVNHVMMVPWRNHHIINANTICHENGHNVFNWMDYYHTASCNLGAYCLMGSGGSNAAPVPITPALRLKAGWITNVVELSGTTTATYTLSANNYTTIHKYTNPYNPKEYLLFHAVKHDRYYQPVLETYPRPEGLAIYYVDEDNGFDGSGDANYQIKLIQADNKDQMHDEDALHINLRGDIYDLYGNGNNSFPNGHPWRWKDGGEFGITLTNITRSGNNVSFTVQGRPNTVLATSDNNGTIHPKGVIKLEDGENPSFLFTSNPGYEINTVKVNGVLIQSPGYRHRIMNASGTQSIEVTYKRITTPLALPSPWNRIDIGGSSPSGYSNFANGKFYMEGYGGDIWNTQDKFHFVYQVINGDGSIEGQLEDMNRPGSWSKAGFMVRASLQTNAAHGMIMYTPGNNTRIQYRTSNGGESSDGPMELGDLHRYNLYKWYRIVRKGNTLTFQLSKDRSTWFQLGEQTINLPQQVYIGMAIVPNANVSPVRAVFRNVKVSENQSAICFAGTKLSGTIIGTTGSIDNAGSTRDKVFDGNTNTFFDAPIAHQAWAGLDLGAAHKVHGIRFFPRQGQTARMTGGKFQASNSADFSTGVVDLVVINKIPVQGWMCLPATHTGSYRYVRYLAPNNGYGNVAEVEFYGTPTPACSPSESLLTGTIVGTAGSIDNAGNTRDKAFDGNINTFFDAPSSQAFIGLALSEPHQITGARFVPRSGYINRMTGGSFQASNNADFSGAVALAMITTPPSSAGWNCISFNNPNGYTYVRYVSPTGGYGNVAEMEFYGKPNSPCSLLGQTLLSVSNIIGTSGSRNSSGNTRDKAFDGNENTFFEGPDDQSWTGLVLSNNHSRLAVQRIRFYPRSGYEYLMAGGKFQGSNSADFSTDTKDLAVIASTPTPGWNCIQVFNNAPFKYVRYVGPANSYGAIAEIQFYGGYAYDSPWVTIANIDPYTNLSPFSSYTVQMSGGPGNLTAISGVDLYLNETLLGSATKTSGSGVFPEIYSRSTGNMPTGNHSLTAVIRTYHGPTAAYTIPISVSQLYGPACINNSSSPSYNLGGSYPGAQGIYWYTSPGLTLINVPGNSYSKKVSAASNFVEGNICAVVVSNNGQTQNTHCRLITRCSGARAGDLEPIEDLLEETYSTILYENPFSTYTIIDLGEATAEANIQVFNTAGILIEDTKAIGSFRFGEYVGPGLYLVRINFENRSETIKLLKQ